MQVLVVVFNGRDARRHVSHRQPNLWRRCFVLFFYGRILMRVGLLLWALKLLHHSLKVEIDFSLMCFDPRQLLLNRLNIETF